MTLQYPELNNSAAIDIRVLLKYRVYSIYFLEVYIDYHLTWVQAVQAHMARVSVQIPEDAGLIS